MQLKMALRVRIKSLYNNSWKLLCYIFFFFAQPAAGVGFIKFLKLKLRGLSLFQAVCIIILAVGSSVSSRIIEQWPVIPETKPPADFLFNFEGTGNKSERPNYLRLFLL